jgi:DNA-binding SARP family transcriptional activator
VWETKKQKDDSESAQVFLNQARVLNMEGKPAHAKAVLDSALQLAVRYEQPVNEFYIRLEFCRTHLRLNDRVEADNALRAALRISEIKQYGNLLLKEFMADKGLFEFAVSRAYARKCVLSALRACNMDIHWISAAFLGVPKVWVDGIEVPNESWPTEKSKKLFFYLLYRKNEPVSVDVLINTMWTRADKKTGGDNLRKAVQHIRGVLKSHGIGGDLLISGYGYYQIVPAVLVQLDTDRLKELLPGVKNIKGKGEGLLKAHKAGLQMFNRGFASGWYDEWVEEVRRSFKKDYEEYLNILLAQAVKTSQHRKAARLGEVLVNLDYYNEDYHRRLMFAYARLKKTRLVEQHFMQLCKTLKKELGAEPQKETLRLYNSLKKA